MGGEPQAYDPTLYKGSAPYYLRGRPPYARGLQTTFVRECALDGTGALLDVGCGPGVLAVELAPVMGTVIGLDPDPEMLEEAAHYADRAGVSNVTWMHGLAEDISSLALPPPWLVTFGQSFHRTDQEPVAESVYDLLSPGGSVAMVAHEIEGSSEPVGPGHPRIPHDAMRDLIHRYLGPTPRAGQGVAPPPAARWEDALARTRFGRPRLVVVPGRDDIVQDIDGVVANYLSMSYAAPHLFGTRLEAFRDDARALLAAHSASGLFWDWPGDTHVVIATKPA